MSVFDRLDTWVVSKYETMAHAIQLRTGINCFRLAVWSLHVYVISSFIALALKYSETGLSNKIMFQLFMVCILAILIHGWIRELERGAEKAESGNYLNPWRHNPVSLTLRSLVLVINIVGLPITLSLPGLDMWVRLITDAAFISAGYLAACTPLPPGMRQTRFVPAPARG